MWGCWTRDGELRLDVSAAECLSPGSSRLSRPVKDGQTMVHDTCMTHGASKKLFCYHSIQHAELWMSWLVRCLFLPVCLRSTPYAGMQAPWWIAHTSAMVIRLAGSDVSMRESRWRP